VLANPAGRELTQRLREGIIPLYILSCVVFIGNSDKTTRLLSLGFLAGVKTKHTEA